jgi:hypothetical protein
MEVTAKELVGLIELNKKRAELEFKRTVLGAKCDADIAAVRKDIESLGAKIGGMNVILPNQRKLDDLGKVLASYGPSEIKEAIKSKSGPAYDALTQRGQIVKANFENKLEIAKLNLEVSRLKDEDRARALDVLRMGAIFGPFALASADEPTIIRIARFLRRCGIPCRRAGMEIIPGGENDSEVRMQITNRIVWVSEETRKKLEQNMSRTQQISMKVQLRNAERQVLVFDDTQERDFASLQQEYLSLLKEQDELLKEFDAEERGQ